MFGISRRNGSYITILLSITFMMYSTEILAQTNGTCVCQPGVIELQLDFALICENSTIVPGLPGIEDAVCVITNGVAAFDEVPISVSNITIAEIDENIDTLKTESYSGTFASGDTVFYTSFGLSDTDLVLNGTIPTGLQVSISAINAANELITNRFVILYTNDCLIYPVLTAGSTIGWASLATLDPPSPDLCPAFVPESDVPSSVPSSVPSDMVSTPPSGVPSLSPTTEKCNCQPGTITFNFDFALACSDRDIIAGNPGIAEAECITLDDSFVEPSDPFPVTVDYIAILEVDQNLDTIQQVNVTGPFVSGDSVTYESYAVTETFLVLAGVIPRGLQVTAGGTNAAGESIRNSFVILYTNDCTVYPVIPDGSIIGWTNLAPLTGPPDGVCPAFIPSSNVPSTVPSTVPSIVPSIVPSSVPSSVPSNIPSIVPSIVPSAVPSDSPLNVETESPAMAQTDAPVMAETDAPIASPIVAPAPIEPPTAIAPPTCAPVGKGKGGKGKGESERSLRTGGGDECPEEPIGKGKMKKEKKDMGKDNMSMDLVKKGKGKGSPKEDKGKSMKGKEKGMGKEKTKAPKEEKEPKKGKMDMSERRQLRPSN